MERAITKRNSYVMNLVQKITLLAIAFFWISFSTYAQTSPASRQTARPKGTTACHYGYYEYLPANYNSESKLPVVIFFHGSGEAGNGTSDLQKLLREGPAMMVQGGKDFPFILISPQHNNGWWNNASIDFLLQYIKKSYKVDNDRIYITGLSSGGYGAWLAGQSKASELAAIVPVSGCGNSNLAVSMKNLAVWAFHNSLDPVVQTTCITSMVTAIRAVGGNPKLTIYQSTDHNAWSATYNNEAMWNWLLTQRRNKSEAIPINKAPFVSAGSDMSITLPVNSVTIKGVATDADGTIEKYLWTQQSGSIALLDYTNTTTFTASGLLEGTYTFRFTATDDSGNSTFDDVIVKVLAPDVTTATGAMNHSTARFSELPLIESGSVSVYPNLLTNRNAITIEFGNQFQGNLIINLLDQIGNLYFTTSTTIDQPTNKYPVDFSEISLPPGIYFLRIRNDGKREKVLKIIKK